LRIKRIVVGAACMLAFTGCALDPNDSTTANTAAPAPDTVPGQTAAPETTSALAYTANGATKVVTAIDNNFGPQRLTIVAGTKVTFRNVGKNVHNVKPKGDPTASTWGVGDAGFGPAAEYSRLFDRPGVYTYYCSIHGTPKAGMFGIITVTAP